MARSRAGRRALNNPTIVDFFINVKKDGETVKVSSKRKGILGKGAEMRAWKRRRKRERIERSIDVHRANISIYVAPVPSPLCR